MKNPSEYRGMHYKQAFIDNRYGENILFASNPGGVLSGNSGSPNYRHRRMADTIRRYTRLVILDTISQCETLRDFRVNHPGCYRAAVKQSDYDHIISGFSPLVSKRLVWTREKIMETISLCNDLADL